MSIGHIFAQCSKNKLAKHCSESLDGYFYDGAVTEKIKLDTVPSIYDFEFIAFSGQDMKLIFCASEPYNVEVNIYNKPKTSKKREIIYSSTEDKNEIKIWQFNVARTERYFIEYFVPANNESSKKSICFSMIIGFKGD